MEPRLRDSQLAHGADAILVRYASEDKEKYAEKVIASLRNEFGGHSVPGREDV